jgi:hypothetical protein
MNVVLISTCDMKSGRGDVLARMLASVERAAPNIAGRVRLFLLLQRCPKRMRTKFAAPSFARIESSEGLMSLSGARNLLLAIAFREDLDWENTVLAFPDDDGWYPPATLETIVNAFTRDRQLDFWFCRYAAAPEPAGAPGQPAARQPGLAEVVRRASSNTIFLRGSLARQVCRFDEELGVGTHNGSGEDTDVALRAFILARRTLYLDAAAVGHRDPDPALRSRYYRGSLTVLASYVGARPGVLREFLRKLLIGGYLVARKELSPSDFLAAAGAAFARLGAQRSLRSHI